MGRSDPTSVAATDVKGGTPSQVTVVFEGVMGSGEQDPVSYSGDTDALGPNPPTACPFPPCNFGVTQCTFAVTTVAVSVTKTVVISVQGPTTKKTTQFTVKP